MRPVADIAREVLSALDDRRQIAPFTGRDEGFEARQAQAAARELARLREARGLRKVGRKIGFTNRSIWPEYNVWAPIWGDMWDATVHEVVVGQEVSIGHLPQPRIEPEIVICLGDDLEPGMDTTAIAERIDWVAHGFEIVQSVFPDWRFRAADCIADGALHGMLLVGARRPVLQAQRSVLPHGLAALTVSLGRDGVEMDRGLGANVLDGPVQALAHLVAALVEDADEPPVRAGDIISTGTITRALPIAPGERWQTIVGNYDLPGMDVAFV
jgi:2-oxo-3-hexenedioate decarboxylase